MAKFTISDVVKIRDEILEKKEIEGIIYTYNLLKKGTFIEKSAEWVFEHTYPSVSLKNMIEKIDQKYKGEEKRGTFIFTGGYGCGKSHNLLVLYHLFDSPEIAKKWAKKWQIDITLPKNPVIILLPLDYDNLKGEDLWKPIFKQLGRTDVLFDVKICPDVGQIEEVVNNKPIVIIIDEIEGWYDTLDSKQQKRNLTFLQNLTQVANSQPLSVFLSLLGRNEDILGIVRRVNPITEDLTVTADRRDIIIFRLFEDSVKEEKAEKVIAGYIEAYKHSDIGIHGEDYKAEMLKTYPFHPEVLGVLLDRYTTARNYQNTRGLLYLLAPVVRKFANERDLVIFSDVDITIREVRGPLSHLNRVLLEKALLDVEETEDIPYSKEILSTVLFYSLGEVKTLGATEKDIILGVLRPEIKLADLTNSLAKLPRNAYHLWLSEDRYLLKEDVNALALVERKARKVSYEQARGKMRDVISQEILSGLRVFVYEVDEEIKDDTPLKVVVSLRHPSDKEELDEFVRQIYNGKQYQNTILLLLPKKGIDVCENEDILNKVRRIIAAGEIVDAVERDKRNQIESLERKERKDLKENLAALYGYFAKWIRGTNTYRPEICKLDKTWIRDKIDSLSSKEEIRAAITQVLKEHKRIQVKQLVELFHTLRGLPVIRDREKVESVLKEMEYKDGEIVIRYEQGGYAYKKYIPRLDDSMSVISKDSLPGDFFETEDEAKRDKIVSQVREVPPEISTKVEKVEEIKPEIPPREELVEEVETWAKNPFALVDDIERKFSDKDTLKELEIAINEKFEGGDALDRLEDFVGSINIVGTSTVSGKIVLKFDSPYTIAEIKKMLNKLSDIENGNIILRAKVTKK